MSPESRSISGNSVLFVFGSAWLVISASNSARSGDGISDVFSGFVKVLVFNSFSLIRSRYRLMSLLLCCSSLCVHFRQFLDSWVCPAGLTRCHFRGQLGISVFSVVLPPL